MEYQSVLSFNDMNPILQMMNVTVRKSACTTRKNYSLRFTTRCPIRITKIAITYTIQPYSRMNWRPLYSCIFIHFHTGCGSRAFTRRHSFDGMRDGNAMTGRSCCLQLLSCTAFRHRVMRLARIRDASNETKRKISRGTGDHHGGRQKRWCLVAPALLAPPNHHFSSRPVRVNGRGIQRPEI
jgi:hypothetical protein